MGRKRDKVKKLDPPLEWWVVRRNLKKKTTFLIKINWKYLVIIEKQDQLSDHFKYVRNNDQFIRAESLEVLAPILKHKKIGLVQNLSFNQSSPRQQESNIGLVKNWKLWNMVQVIWKLWNWKTGNLWEYLDVNCVKKYLANNSEKCNMY